MASDTSRERWLAAAMLALVACVSGFARVAQHRRVELPGRAGWFTTDPDTQYQVRRFERCLDEGLPPANADERMNAPHGAPIPWPPYYSGVLAVALGPFAPVEGRAEWSERAVASAALVFSVLGSLLAALAARSLAGNVAGLVAGLLHALCGASVAYGKLGNGDHHAFVSLVAGAMLFALSAGFGERALASVRRSVLLGAAAGTLAGLAMGSWVASLLFVIEVQLALGVLLVLHARAPRAGTAALGLSFHLAALAVVLPAVLASPWKRDLPWIVVNLSWFHPSFLALGALVFAPLPWLGESRWRTRYPWLVAGALVLLGAWIAVGSGGPARGVREGFEWVSRTDAFMARVGESRRLVGAGTGGALFDALGYAVLALPAAWALMLARARRESRLWPWTVAVPLLAVQAAAQARFAEALALPLAVALGWCAASAMPASWRGKAVPHALAAAALAIAGSWPTVARSVQRALRGPAPVESERSAMLGARLACEWIARRPLLDPGESVLAMWTHGHLIERVAGRASVATNFGSYVGLEGFAASSRFHLCEDPDEADALLERHRARFVLVDSDLPNSLNTQLDSVEPERRARYVAPGSEHGGQVLAPWFLTLGARAMFDGAVFGPLAPGSRPLDRLRLVWSAPLADRERPLRGPSDFAPAAWVWERVAGAVVEARGAPGEPFVVKLAVEFASNGRTLRWRDETRVGADGLARLRVPYATDAPNGDGSPAAATWSVGSERGSLRVPERTVREGAKLAVP